MNGQPNLAPLESRAVLRMAGKDRFGFLQNLVSQDMALVEAGKPIFTAFLTPQGKYLFDFFIVPESGDSFLLDIEAERKDDFLARLSRYRLRADIDLQDVQHEYKVYAAWGEGFSHPQAFTDPRLAELGQRLILKKDEVLKTDASESHYREHRYRLGVAEGGHEIAISEATLMEVNFDALNGISFSKGCYLGQELTARLHYRGLTKRRILPFRFEGVAPKKFERILHKGFEIGEVRAVGEEYGLGLFHLKAVEPFLNGGEPLVHDSTTFEVFVPEYLKEILH